MILSYKIHRCVVCVCVCGVRTCVRACVRARARVRMLHTGG